MRAETDANRVAAGGGRRRGARLLALALLAYGAAGVLCTLRLPSLLVAAVVSLGGASSFRDPPPNVPGFGLLVDHYSARPWLPWACWLAGLALLAWSRGAGAAAPAGPAAPAAGPPAPAAALRFRRGRQVGLAALVLLGLLALGAYARLNVLVPQARGLTQAPYDDEGVYAGANQLVMQGILPYRDFFFAHPPLAALVYIPALAYHFTAWGSVTSFMIARYLSVIYSLGALAVLFAVGWRLGTLGASSGAARWRPLLFGATAAGLWAIDERAIEINRKIMLDQPMILASLLALLLYLSWLRRPRQPGANGSGLLIAAGALAAISAFTKIQGLACIVALGLDLAWRLRPRRPPPGADARPTDLLALLGGFAGVAAIVLGPFLVLTPGPFLRMIGFFQLLRPGDGLRLPAERIANLTATLENGPTIYLAGLGFVALTCWVVGIYRAPAAGAGAPPAAADGRALGGWRPLVLWSFLSVLLFTYSRSFYGHYYVQLGAALCVLAPATWLPLLRPVGGRVPPRALAYALLLVPAILLVRPAWQSFTTRADDPVFAVVGRYVNDAVPPETAVLSSDEQFNFLASRPPSRNATGYLIDSYGHMIFLGLGLDARPWSDLLGAVLRGEHSDSPYQAMWQPAPQADYLDRARRAALIVIHDRGIPRLREETRAAVLAQDTLRVQQPTGCRSDMPPTRGGCRYLILAAKAAR